MRITDQESFRTYAIDHLRAQFRATPDRDSASRAGLATQLRRLESVRLDAADDDDPDYRAGAEYARRRPPKGTVPMSNQDPSYPMRRRAAVDRFRPVDREPTPAEQARMDAEGAEFDRREQAVREMKADRGSVVRTDFATSVPPKPDDLDKALARSRKRMNYRAANAWREPLDKEGQVRADEHRAMRDEDQAVFFDGDGDAA